MAGKIFFRPCLFRRSLSAKMLLMDVRNVRTGAALGQSGFCSEGVAAGLENRARMRRISAGTSIISASTTMTVVSGSPMVEPRLSVAMAMTP